MPPYTVEWSLKNIILDIIFVKILGMGVSGVAIATNISQFISCILALRFLMSVSDAYKVCLNNNKLAIFFHNQ